MMKAKAAGRLVIGLLVGGWLAACTNAPQTHKADVLIFTERNPEVESYTTRMIVTPQFLRIDEGEAGNDFVLFDRGRQTIYSSSARDRRILVIKAHPVTTESPIVLTHDEIRDDASVPPMAGKTVTHFQFLTNQQVCFDVFSAEGLLPGPLEGLREYHRALAGEQAKVLDGPGAAFQTPCDLANNVYLPDRHLSRGFPIRQQDMTGRVRELTDFRVEAVDPALLRLPQGYEFFTVEDMRGR